MQNPGSTDPTPTERNVQGPDRVVQDAPADRSVVAIAATFTAEPLADTLGFWLERLGLPYRVEFAPYNQVFQQLLDPSSLLSRNERGVNVLLVRFEDWQRQEHSLGEGVDPQLAELRGALVDQHLGELVEATRAAVARWPVQTVLILCPFSPHLAAADRALVEQAEACLVRELAGIDGLTVIDRAECNRLYPVSNYYDGKSDALGHVPFTGEFFAALATMLARRTYALTHAPYKVIALDCDQTIWKGVCGEDGPLGVEIDPPRRMLQEFMVAQSDAGMLICLCSKNVEEDVWAVFEQRQDMPLKKEHVVAWRINWQAKSENLRALAAELNLGLDSVIFVDDNPVECSEVVARCPEVLTLELPREVERIPSFLNHVWPFDRLKVTDADRQRTAMYRQNLERERFQQAGQDFQSFIEGLQLQIDIAPMQAGDLSRVAQLTQRTNQFNATTIRRSESEIAQWCATDGQHCLTVNVTDRFGDYGLVGVILFRNDRPDLYVDTFLLSCRVLGRGVEHRMVKELGALAREQGHENVVLSYSETPKNRPAADFLETIGAAFRIDGNPKREYRLPVAYACDLNFTPTEPPGGGARAEEKGEKSEGPRELSADRSPPVSQSARWNDIASHLTSASAIAVCVDQARHARRPRSASNEDSPGVEPRNDIEAILTTIWSEVLRIDPIGVTDNFFELGGSSLLAVGVFTRIEDAFKRRLPITTLLTAPTIELLARVVTEDVDESAWNPLVPARVHGSRRPLFVVHGGFGDVLGLTELAKHLSDDQPFYALRAFGLDGERGPLETVEAMAEQYVKAIRTVQPDGPYRLAGQCAGGVVAFEMAQQLVRAGERVEFLGLFETAHPQVENHFMSRLRYYWHRPSYRHGLWDWNYYVFTLVAYWHRFVLFGSRHKRELKRRDWFARFGYAALQPFRALAHWFGDRYSARPGQEPTPIDQAADDQSRVCAAPHSAFGSGDAARRFFLAKERFFEVFLRAQGRYHPTAYPGTIDFFVTMKDSWIPRYSPYDPRSLRRIHQISPVDDPKQLRIGWDALVTADNFVFHAIDSGHQTVLGEPDIQLLGRVVDDRLSASSDA